MKLRVQKNSPIELLKIFEFIFNLRAFDQSIRMSVDFYSDLGLEKLLWLGGYLAGLWLSLANNSEVWFVDGWVDGILAIWAIRSSEAALSVLQSVLESSAPSGLDCLTSWLLSRLSSFCWWWISRCNAACRCFSCSPSCDSTFALVSLSGEIIVRSESFETCRNQCYADFFAVNFTMITSSFISFDSDKSKATRVSAVKGELMSAKLVVEKSTTGGAEVEWLKETNRKSIRVAIEY